MNRFTILRLEMRTTYSSSRLQGPEGSPEDRDAVERLLDSYTEFVREIPEQPEACEAGERVNAGAPAAAEEAQEAGANGPGGAAAAPAGAGAGGGSYRVPSGLAAAAARGGAGAASGKSSPDLRPFAGAKAGVGAGAAGGKGVAGKDAKTSSMVGAHRGADGPAHAPREGGSSRLKPGNESMRRSNSVEHLVPMMERLGGMNSTGAGKK